MLTLSRFVNASTISKNPSQISTSLAFIPIYHHASVLKNDLKSYDFEGSVTRSLQYNPARLNFVVHNNMTPSGAPFPSGPPSGSLRNWVVGIVLTFILPFVTHKWGPLILLKNKVEKVMDSTEHVMEAIEVVAKGADDIIDEITNELPQNSKLKETMEAIDEVVEGVAKGAHIANKIIDKVEETEEKLESLNILDEVKQEEVSIRVSQEEEASTQEPSVEK